MSDILLSIVDLLINTMPNIFVQRFISMQILYDQSISIDIDPRFFSFQLLEDPEEFAGTVDALFATQKNAIEAGNEP